MRGLPGLVLLRGRWWGGIGDGPRDALAKRARGVMQGSGLDAVSRGQVVPGAAAVRVVQRRLSRLRSQSTGPAPQQEQLEISARPRAVALKCLAGLHSRARQPLLVLSRRVSGCKVLQLNIKSATTETYSTTAPSAINGVRLLSSSRRRTGESSAKDQMLQHTVQGRDPTAAGVGCARRPPPCTRSRASYGLRSPQLTPQLSRPLLPPPARPCCTCPLPGSAQPVMATTGTLQLACKVHVRVCQRDMS